MTVLFAALAVGCAPREVVVGVVVPLTGAREAYGHAVLRGAELAVASRAKGVRVQLEVRDSKSDPVTAAALLAELYEDGAVAAVGGMTPEELEAMTPVGERFGRALMVAAVGSEGDGARSMRVMRVGQTAGSEGLVLGALAIRRFDAAKWALLVGPDRINREIASALENEIARHGFSTAVYELGSRDAAEEAAGAAMASGAGAVWVGADWRLACAAINALRLRGYEGHVLASSALAVREGMVCLAGEGAFLERHSDGPHALSLGEAALEGVVIPLALQSDSDFVASHVDRYGFAPDLYSELGFEAVSWLADAARVADGPGDVARVLFATESQFTGRRFDAVDGYVDAQAWPRIWILRNAEPNRLEQATEHERRERIQHQLRELEERQRQLAWRGGACI